MANLNYCNSYGEVKFTAPVYPTHSDAPYVYINNYTILGSKHLTLFAMPAPIYKYNTILYNGTIFGCQKADLGTNFHWYCYEYWYNNAEERAKGWVQDTTRTLTYYEGDYGWGDVSSGSMWSVGGESPSWANHNIIDYVSGDVYFAQSPDPRPEQYVTAITITSQQSALVKGWNNVIAVTVAGVGDFDKTCIVSIGGNASANTKLEKAGNTENQYFLYVDEAETASNISVFATAAADDTIVDTLIIPVSDELDPDGGNGGGSSSGGNGTGSDLNLLLQGIAIGMKIKGMR